MKIERRPILPLSELRLTNERDVFAGVCSGFAYWLGIAPWLVRAGVLALAAITGLSPIPEAWSISLDFFNIPFNFAIVLPLYALAYFLLPEWEELPADFEARCWMAERPSAAGEAPSSAPKMAKRKAK